MSQLNPYIHFNGNCKEAMEFYKSVFGGELSLMIVGESPMAAQMPKEVQNQVLHSMLKNGNVVLMASDAIDQVKKTNGDMLRVCLSSENVEELKGWFDKLSEGGKVLHNLETMFFGTYGDLLDKFGISWMFESDAKKA